MRYRATAIVMRNNRVLLVRDKGRHKYSLPGGGINKGEPTISAVSRELFEELGLSSTKVARLRQCDFKGSVSLHKVCLVEVRGEPHLRGHELDRFIWWNLKDDIPVYSHVQQIIRRM